MAWHGGKRDDKMCSIRIQEGDAIWSRNRAVLFNAPIAFQLLNYDYDTTARTGNALTERVSLTRPGAESSLQMGPAGWSSYWSSSTLVARNGFISLFSYSPQCRAGEKLKKTWEDGIRWFREIQLQISADKRHRFLNLLF